MIPNPDKKKAPLSNYLYVGVEVIERMISRVNRNMDFDRDDIAEWCWEVLEAGGHANGFQFFEDFKLPIVNGFAKIPCGVYRVLRIRTGSGARLDDYTNYGNELEVKQEAGTCLKIDYLGVPVDENGKMQIYVEFKKACFYYCLQMVLMERYLNGQIPDNRWDRIERKYWGWLSWGRGSWRGRTMDDGDRNREANFLFTRTPRGNRDVIYHGKGY